MKDASIMLDGHLFFILCSNSKNVCLKVKKLWKVWKVEFEFTLFHLFPDLVANHIILVSSM